MNISRQAIAWTLGTALAVGGVSAAVAIGPIFPLPSTSPASTLVVETPEPVITPEPVVTPTPTVAPVEAPAPAVEAPAPPPVSVPYSNSGQPLPFYPSSDPENASGGDYADPGSFCTSGSASTVGGVPTCD